jgi:hypothetical protein
MNVKWNIEVHSCNNCCSRKAINITNSECVSVCLSVALVIKHAKRMRRGILSFVASSSLQHFSTLPHTGLDFRKRTLLNIKSVFWFPLQHLSETFLILRRTEQYIIIHVYWLSDFHETRVSWTDFRKILKCQISWKSVQWQPSCSVRTDRQTDMTKAWGLG